MKKISSCIIIISLLLLAAIAWHTLAFDHDHPKELFGDGIQAILHGEDRKWLVLNVCILVLLAWGTLFIGMTRHGVFWHMPTYWRGFGMYKTALIAQYTDPMKRALKKGIIHQKLCEWNVV